MKSKKKLFTLVSAIAVILVASLLTVNVTLSWIETANSPVFQASKIELQTSPGLVMTIDGKQADLVDLNKYLSDSSDKVFILSECSSYDGNTIYVRMENSGEDILLKLADETDRNSTFIDKSVQLKSEVACDIYLGDTSLIGDAALTYIKTLGTATEQSLKPIRVALSYSYTDPDTLQEVKGATKIFAVDKSYSTRAARIVDNTSHKFVDEGGSAVAQAVHTFDEYCYNSSASAEENAKKVWFSLPANAEATVDIKVWLEGADANCTDEISGSQVQMRITFFTPQSSE